MERIIQIDGKEVGLKATALTPRLYRHKFGRDMVADMTKLKKAYRKATNLPEDITAEEKEDAQLSALDLEIFENAAWIMAMQYDAKKVANTPDEWLDGFAIFSIYEVLPVILELWQFNNATTSEPKKK